MRKPRRPTLPWRTPPAFDVPSLPAEDAPAFRVVFICTGNRARSPLAEALFRRHAREGSPIVVESFGTLAIDNQQPIPGVMAIAPSLGVDVERHRSRRLRDGTLSGADLVVGFEPSHAELAVSVGGAAPERTFMILEMSVLLDRIDGQPAGVASPAMIERARKVVQEMSRQRGPLGALPARALADPVGEPAQVLAETARTIDILTAALAEELFPVG